MEMSGMRLLDLLGASVATAIFILANLVFIARLAGRAEWEYWFGVALLLTAVRRPAAVRRATRRRRTGA